MLSRALGGAVLAALVLALPPAALGATFTVDVTTDGAPDAPVATNGCEATGGDECTLREAIAAANATVAADSIVFSVANNSVIDIDFAGQGTLPSITQPVSMGGSAIGFVFAEINGPGPGSGADPVRNGLRLTSAASGSSIRGLSIVDFDNGLVVDGADNVSVESNRIGRRANGNALGNGNSAAEMGILVDNDTNSDSIRFNEIVANSNGIALDPASDLTTIEGNLIGTDGAGTAGLGNTFTGVAAGASDDTTILNNTIVSSGGGAVIVAGQRAVIRGNTIGVSSSTVLPNSGDGILVSGNPGGSATIGGPLQSDGNVVAASGGAGVRLENDAGDNTLQNNTIGTDSAGNTFGGASRNGGGGVVVNKGPGNRIGTPGAGNRISANANDGILVEDTLSLGPAPSATRIESNVIGEAGGNQSDGIEVDDGASGTVIGSPGAGNTVMDNGSDGIAVNGGATTTVQGNRSGVNAAGTAPRGNGDDGISVNGADGTIVGGLGAGEGNLSSANGEDGVDVQNNADDTVVRGNLLGTNAAATLGFPNDRGVRVEGDRVVVERNTIAGNVEHGIELDSGDDIRVEGNNVGRTAAGTAIPNGEEGINADSAVNGTVGGPGAAANVIAFNLGDGVRVEGTTPQLTVAENAVFSNGGLGIDVGPDGVTANDTGDGDTGPNGLQNFPELSSAAVSGGQTSVAGSLNSTASTALIVRFYASGGCDGSGSGEGERFLGAVGVTTDGAGNASFALGTLPGTAAGEQITATATGPNGTSEFSACRTVETPPALATISPDTARVAEGERSSFTVTRSGSTSQDAVVFVSSSDGSARAGSDYDAIDTAVFFAAGESSKTIALATRDDTAAEGDETLTVALTSGVRVAPGSPSSAAVTIAGNDRVPDSDIKSLKSQKASSLKRITGTASDDDGDLLGVQVAIFRKAGSRSKPICQNINSKGNVARGKVDSKKRCRPSVFLAATGTSGWTFRLRKALPPGTWTIASRASDGAGLRETTFSGSDRNQANVKLR